MSEQPGPSGSRPDDQRSWGAPTPPPAGRAPLMSGPTPSAAWRPPRQRRTPLVVAAVVAVVIVAVAVTALIYVLLPKHGSTTTPTATAHSFVASLRNDDCGQIKAVSSSSLDESIGDCGNSDSRRALAELSQFGEVKGYRVKKQTASTATVEVTVTAGTYSVPIDFSMVKQGDQWLVDDVGAFGFDLGHAPSV